MYERFFFQALRVLWIASQQPCMHAYLTIKCLSVITVNETVSFANRVFELLQLISTLFYFSFSINFHRLVIRTHKYFNSSSTRLTFVFYEEIRTRRKAEGIIDEKSRNELELFVTKIMWLWHKKTDWLFGSEKLFRIPLAPGGVQFLARPLTGPAATTCSANFLLNLES